MYGTGNPITINTGSWQQVFPGAPAGPGNSIYQGILVSNTGATNDVQISFDGGKTTTGIFLLTASSINIGIPGPFQNLNLIVAQAINGSSTILATAV